MPASRKSKRPHYVLILESNVHHAELLTEILDRHFAPIIIHTVDTIGDGIEFARQANYDLILTDGVVGDTPITDSMPELIRIAGPIPIVVISGKGDEKLAAELIKLGAAEYMVKTRETLEVLPASLDKYLKDKRGAKRRRTPTKAKKPDLKSSPTEILRAVDRLTQQALAIVGPRRRRRRTAPEIEQLNHLLTQIRRLREMAQKLTHKE